MVINLESDKIWRNFYNFWVFLEGLFWQIFYATRKTFTFESFYLHGVKHSIWFLPLLSKNIKIHSLRMIQTSCV